MISAFIGDNSFDVKEAIAALTADFSGQPERYDGEALGLEQVADLLGGQLLFSNERLVIIRELSKNSLIWPRLPEWLEGASDSTHIVLIDEKPDKRTATYKALKNAGVVREFPVWSERDHSAAERWVSERAARQDLSLTPALARHLVDRVGLDQWQLASAIDKLSLLDTVSKQAIDEHIDAHPTENIFQLFELALTGRRDKVRQALRTLELSEDPYAVFALLCSQAVQLAAVALAGKDTDPAKDFGIHPFVISKLARTARPLGREGARRIVGLFARTDAQLKTSAAEPWRLIEKTLYQL